MNGRVSCWPCAALGLLLSALLHGAVAGWLLIGWSSPRGQPPNWAVLELDLAAFNPPSTGAPGEPVPREIVPQAKAETVAEASVPVDGPEGLSPQRAEPEPPAPPEIRAIAAHPDVREDLASAEINAGPESVRPTDSTSTQAANPPQSIRKREQKPRAKPEKRARQVAKREPVGRVRAQPHNPSPTNAAEVPRAETTPWTPVRPGAGAAAAGGGPTKAQMGTAQQAAPNPSAGAAEAAYLAELQRAIARHQRFPDDARRRQKTGVATLSFVVQGDGSIRRVHVLRSSGDTSLDEAAVQAMQRLNRFKPIPAVIGRQEWAMRVPIRFDLR